jgi:AsmA-like protein
MAANEAQQNGIQSRPAPGQGSAGFRHSLNSRMDRKSILTKTAKGLMEATGKTSDLSRDLRNLLKEIDGKVSVGQLQMRQELFTEAKFMDALRTLEKDGYVREITPQKDEPVPPPARNPTSKGGADAGEDLDFTAIASRTGAKKAADISQQISAERDRVEAAAKAKADAEARAKRETEEQTRKLAYESEEKKKRDELDRIHREADERNRKAAEEKARREAEDKAKRDAEERRQREEEDRRRREIEDKARREAEEKARREGEERARREAAERARREAEDKAKREAEERRRREEEERRRREDEERSRREAEEREKREEEERRRREEERRRAEEDDERRKREDERRRWEIEARAEAAELEEAIRRERTETEEKVRRENEERVRREEDERRRQEEASRLRPASGGEAEDEISRREEEMRRREQEEAARAKQEAKERAEAEAQAAAQARKDAREREKALEEEDRRAKDAERARQRAAKGGRAHRRAHNVGKPVAVGLFFILAISVAVMHFVPIDSTPYEKTAQEWLGQPVRIGAVYIQLVPSPHLRFERVTIGKDPQMRVPVARAAFALSSILDDRKTLRRIDIEGATVPPAFLAGLLSSGGSGRSPGVDRVAGKAIKLDLPGLPMPDVDVDARLDSRGGVTTVRLSNAERGLSATLEPQAGRATLEITAAKFTLPIGANLAFEEFSAKGIVGRNELALSQFEGRALNGVVQGNGRLRWGDGWTLDGEFAVRQIDAAKIAAPIVAGGTLEGKGVYGMKAAAPDKLFEAARMEGHFTIQKGTITNVDMTRILQGSSTGGGTTLFSEMSGSASADAGRIQVRQLRMAAGLLQGAGQVDVDAEKNLSGRVQIELRAQTVQARATLSVSGNLKNPQFRRTN